MARVEQLKQRLDHERSCWMPAAGQPARPAPALSQLYADNPPMLPTGFGERAVRRQPSADAPADPFDIYERGELRTTPAAPAAVEAVRRAEGGRPMTSPNPAVVTGSGETFVFRHMG